MSRWSRFAFWRDREAGEVLRPIPSDDPVYLTRDAAMAGAQKEGVSNPRIRITQWSGGKRVPPPVARRPLLERLRLRKPRVIDEQSIGPTKIVGTPVKPPPAPRIETPSRADMLPVSPPPAPPAPTPPPAPVLEQRLAVTVSPPVAPTADRPALPVAERFLLDAVKELEAQKAPETIKEPEAIRPQAGDRPAAKNPPPLPRRAAPKAAGVPAAANLVRPAPAGPIVKPQAPAGKKADRGDFVVAALGVTLGLVCALFPWYIFFNQDKFGVREFVFEGSRNVQAPSRIAYQPQLVGKPFQTGEVPKMDLDFFPTATAGGSDDNPRAVPASEQPFPADLVSFRLVHVANGRAMIQDDDGLWVVQPGSRLPDASQVASIEQRDGRWVLVTTLDRVVTLER